MITRRPIALIALCTLVGCDGVTTVKGKVVSGGNPVEGAKVMLDEERGNPPHPQTTEADGSFDITRVHAPGRFQLKLSVTKDGFTDHDESVQSNHVYQRVIELKPLKAEQLPPSN